MKNKANLSSQRPYTAAFLTENHRGMSVPAPKCGTPIAWTPDKSTDHALGLLPKLTAEIGFAMAGRQNISVEILPGSPTTVAFSAGNKLLSLMVLPVTADQARQLLGISPVVTSDLVADQLWEEQRQVPTPEALLLTERLAWNS